MPFTPGAPRAAANAQDLCIINKAIKNTKAARARARAFSLLFFNRLLVLLSLAGGAASQINCNGSPLNTFIQWHGFGATLHFRG